VRFQADADLNHHIVAATRQREPGIDFQSAAELDLEGVSDPDILELAAEQGRVLVTHDRRTMPNYFRTRLVGRKTSPGVLIAPQFAPVDLIVEALILIWSASDSEDWRNQIYHLPSFARHVFSR
jgi:Domain of unknown function (DUF5615)